MFNLNIDPEDMPNGKEDIKELMQKADKLRREVANKMIDDDEVDKFEEFLTEHFKGEGIAVNSNTVKAFKEAFELIMAKGVDKEAMFHMVMVCDKYLGRQEKVEKDRELFERMRVADPDDDDDE